MNNYIIFHIHQKFVFKLVKRNAKEIKNLKQKIKINDYNENITEQEVKYIFLTTNF